MWFTIIARAALEGDFSFIARSYCSLILGGFRLVQTIFRFAETKFRFVEAKLRSNDTKFRNETSPHAAKFCFDYSPWLRNFADIRTIEAPKFRRFFV